MLRFRKYSSHLRKLYEEQNELLNSFDDLIVSTGCYSCDQYNSSKIKTFTERFKNCTHCNGYDKMVEMAIKLDSIDESIDSFIESDYALVVYNHFRKKKPLLLNKSGQIVNWDDAFGADFNTMSKESKHYLVGLAEKTGKYSIK